MSDGPIGREVVSRGGYDGTKGFAKGFIPLEGIEEAGEGEGMGEGVKDKFVLMDNDLRRFVILFISSTNLSSRSKSVSMSGTAKKGSSILQTLKWSIKLSSSTKVALLLEGE